MARKRKDLYDLIEEGLAWQREMLPIMMDAKIFQSCDDDGQPIGEPYSYNDCIKKINDMSGVNPDLLGSNDDR